MNRLKRSTLVVGISASLSLLAAAPAGFAAQKWGSTDGPTPDTNATTHMSTTDDAFARNAAEGGMAEVKLGHLAEEKGTTQAVKDFGKRMVTDHSKADEQLKSAASKDKITLPSSISAKNQTEYDNLAKLSGTPFDEAYANDMVRDHEVDVSDFQHEAKDGKDLAIKNFAAQTTPVLQEHLKLARDMESSVPAMK